MRKTVAEWGQEAEQTPVVSIVCWSYNHAEFLGEAITSFLTQKTSVPVEIIIHDDASTDGSREIIRSFERRLPELFRNIIQDTNRFQAGLDINDPPYRQARGEFIALCEGDDYWTQKDKLQRQVDFLKTNPECVGVFHRGHAVDDKGQFIPFIWDDLVYKDRYAQGDCIFELLSGYPTAALMFRRSALKFPFPKYFTDHPTDYMTDVMVTENGALGFLDFDGCAYRQHAGGTWSNLRVSEMKLHGARRLVSLYCDPALKSRYPTLETRMLSQLDMAWWLKFQESGETLTAWMRASLRLIQSPIFSQRSVLWLWLKRSQCPIRHKLRDLLRAPFSRLS